MAQPGVGGYQDPRRVLFAATRTFSTQRVFVGRRWWNANSPSKRTALVLTTCHRLAREYQLAGKYLPALEIYDALIGAGQADATTWRETGNALADVGEYAQAQDAFRHCLDLDADDAEAHNNRARVLYRLGDLDAAYDHLWRAIALSDSITAWQNLATMIPACPPHRCAGDPTGAAGIRRQTRSTVTDGKAYLAPIPAKVLAASDWLPLFGLSLRELHEAGVGADQPPRSHRLLIASVE